MKRLFARIVLAGMLLSAGGARADEPTQTTIDIWGLGNETCGAWITNRKDPSATGMTKVNYTEIWITGFVTGLNAGLPRTNKYRGDVGNGLDFPALAIWLDNYCHTHPRDIIVGAANEFYDSVSENSPP